MTTQEILITLLEENGYRYSIHKKLNQIYVKTHMFNIDNPDTIFYKKRGNETIHQIHLNDPNAFTKILTLLQS